MTVAIGHLCVYTSDYNLTKIFKNFFTKSFCFKYTKDKFAAQLQAGKLIPKIWHAGCIQTPLRTNFELVDIFSPLLIVQAAPKLGNQMWY